ncbi:uncharacterized protein LOC134845039 [Symsagittifera roscoffensis]|uniref:uncharacterized protein LOC134845039 n=1 Tax=Symsagittifera roscoffensis TaxID=84072 RepID=UPI00307B9D5A
MNRKRSSGYKVSSDSHLVDWQQVKRMYSRKTHYIGFVDLCSTDNKFCKLLIKSLEHNCSLLKTSLFPSRKSSDHTSIRSFQLDEDQEPLIENSDEECGAESEALAALQNSYVDETEKLALKVASFNFWEALACINLQVKTKQSDRLVGMIKSVLSRSLLALEMDSQGTEIFDYLLPKKEAEFRERLNNLLVGFIIVTNSDDVITSSQKHFPCDQVEKKMNELKVAMSEQYSLHDILQRDLGARREPRKFPLVFVNPAGSEYKNGPTMISQEIFLLSETSCAICMALSSNYNCAFAADMTQAMAFLMDQDIFIKYPEAIDRATLELIC